MASSNTITNTMNSSSAPRTVVGQVYINLSRPWWVPAGLESTQGPGAKPVYYSSPFFGGDREYIDDEDGWTVVRNGRRRNRRSHKPRKMMIMDDDASTVA